MEELEARNLLREARVVVDLCDGRSYEKIAHDLGLIASNDNMIQGIIKSDDEKAGNTNGH